MTHTLPAFALAFLSHDWAGLVLAAIIAALAGVCIRVARARSASWAARLGYMVLGIAGLMALGALYHVVHMGHVRAQYPPPGKLVDIGGYRLHVLAEGEARGKPPVVWIGGGHAAGFSMHHLHRMLRNDARSILIDRPGAGWSDIGPFPRTTAGEAEEVVAALEKAGEKGPFVLVGYSFGGLLAANIARRHPEILTALVLMDATPPDTIIYTAPNPGLSRAPHVALLSALQRLFGIHPGLAQRLWARDPDRGGGGLDDLVKKCLGTEIFAAMQAIETGARSSVAAASIDEELTPQGLASVGWQTVVYDGDLGDLPVFLVAPGDLLEFDGLSESIDRYARDTGSAEAIDKVRLRRFYNRTRERYLATSSRSERIYTPAGTHHVYGYETPEFVADVVRKVLVEHPRRDSQQTNAATRPTGEGE